jgi:hypothetical protein
MACTVSLPVHHSAASAFVCVFVCVLGMPAIIAQPFRLASSLDVGLSGAGHIVSGSTRGPCCV